MLDDDHGIPAGTRLAARETWRSWLQTAGRVIAYVASFCFNALALGCALSLWRSWLSGEYRTDPGADDGMDVLFFAFGALSAGMSLVISGLVAALRLVPRWWCIPPAVLLAAVVIANRAMS